MVRGIKKDNNRESLKKTSKTSSKEKLTTNVLPQNVLEKGWKMTNQEVLTEYYFGKFDIHFNIY